MMMASSSSAAAALLFLLLVAVAAPSRGVFAARTHVVGDSFGWRIPQQNANVYIDWASKQTFAVGDTLLFNFATGEHNVIRVPKSSYDACTSQGQIDGTVSTGPARITLNSTGPHYYICGVGQHCSFGQKVTITVASSSSGGGAQPPSPAPSAGRPTSPGASSPPTSTPGAPPSTPGLSSPPPTSSTPGTPTSPGPSGRSSSSPPSHGFFGVASLLVSAVLSVAVILF